MSRLTGSPISADKPIGVFGGHQIMSIDRCCGDHGEQMIAPVRALGYEYVAAPHGDRKPVSEERIYRIIGAVDNTNLTYDPPNVGPATVNLGQQPPIEAVDARQVADDFEDAHHRHLSRVRDQFHPGGLHLIAADAEPRHRPAPPHLRRQLRSVPVPRCFPGNDEGSCRVRIHWRASLLEGSTGSIGSRGGRGGKGES